MASSDKELEQQLLEAGNKLLESPSSVEELLPILDQIENCLSRVEQSPTVSMQTALAPSQRALIADQLFGHSDVDVKVAVASCISEITRITAPEAPYGDDQMREVFQLIVSSFQNLSDKSSRSYAKRASILETVAKVRSCVVMLDLECDALLVEMFQHFLKAIRDHHPDNVFSSMETIMTLVLEESEDISLELLSPILACVRKDNKDVLPIARRLGERVLEICAAKLKPYLLDAVKSSGLSLDDYSEVVASVCQEASGAVEQNDAHVSNEHTADVNESKSVVALLDEAAQEDKEIAAEAASTEEVDPAIDKSPKSVVSNGITQTREDDCLADSNSVIKQENEHLTDQSKNVDTSSNAEPDSLGTDKTVSEEQKAEQNLEQKAEQNPEQKAEQKPEQKAEQTTKKRAKKPSSPVKLTEPTDDSHIYDEKEAETLPEHNSSNKDAPSSPREEPSMEGVVSSENEKETSIKLSSPKATEGESTDVLPSPSRSVPNESRSQRAGRPKKKESSIKEAMASADDLSRKVSEGTSDSETKSHKHSGKKMLPVSASKDKTPTVIDKKESSSSSDSEERPLKHSAKKVDTSNNNGDRSSLKQPDAKKKREKATSRKDVTKSSIKDDKEIVSSPKSAAKSIKNDHLLEETPKTSSKRKRTPGKETSGKENASDAGKSGQNLVGSNVKVWWPKDRKFYEGIIDSYDPVKRKHLVLYHDGDQEILNLKKEKWEFIEGDSKSDGEETSPVASSEMPQKKKVKTSSDQSTKQGKTDNSPKKGSGASSSKSKVAAGKSGRKSKDESKGDGKSKDGSRSVNKSENDSVSKMKDKDGTTKSGTKSVDVVPKSGSKSKNDATDMVKSSKSKESGSGTLKNSSKSKQESSEGGGKSKQETPKISSGGKSKTSKSSGKSNGNGTGKLKSSSSTKVKESEEDVKESSDSEKEPEEAASLKRKSPPSPPKTPGSEAKSGKKRRKASKS